jgi:hypothetical protein
VGLGQPYRSTNNENGLITPDVAQTLNNLADLYSAQGRYDAEPLYKRALASTP